MRMSNIKIIQNIKMKYEYQSEISQLSDWEILIIPIINKDERKNFNTLL